jgi:hypothetical protein
MRLGTKDPLAPRRGEKEEEEKKGRRHHVSKNFDAMPHPDRGMVFQRVMWQYKNVVKSLHKKKYLTVAIKFAIVNLNSPS